MIKIAEKKRHGSKEIQFVNDETFEFDERDDYQSMSRLSLLSILTMWPPPKVTARDPNPNLALTAPAEHIAMQLTLMMAAVYKRIQPLELVPKTRKKNGVLCCCSSSLFLVHFFLFPDETHL